MQGYPVSVCGQEGRTPRQGFFSVRGGGIGRLIWREKPAAVILSQILYWWDFVVIATCALRRIPLCLRVETQDEAFIRPAWKTAIRFMVWRLVYAFFDWSLFFGTLNRRHLLRHGFREAQLVRAPFCVGRVWIVL